MELNEHQLLYIRTAYSYFRENLQWPTYRQVQKKILPIHRRFRALNVAKSIEKNAAAHFHQTFEDKATLSLQEIRQLPESEQDLADLVKVIHYSVEKYITEDKEEVRISSEEIKQHFSFDEATVWKIYQLLGLNAGITNGGSSSSDEKTWDFRISDDAVEYQGVVSIDDFLQRREEIIKNHHPGYSQSLTLQNIFPQTDQHTIVGLIEPPAERVKIFFCYAHEDAALLDQLKQHLKPLQRQGIFDMWYDQDISAGTEWKREIDKHLNAADIILLLISPDFISSEYCYSVEMKRALERHEQREARVVPIILRHIHWEVQPLYRLQALPKDALPVISSAWHDPDAAFYDVVEGILKVFAEISGQSLPQVS